MPVIVWVHGGGWKDGNKNWRRAVPLVPKGYAVANINYRLSQDAVFPAQIEDCKAAIRWLRANAAKYRLDPDHVGVWGPSAGGHLVALLGTTAGVKELEGSGAISTSRAASSASSIGSAPRTWPLWAGGTTSRTPRSPG